MARMCRTMTGDNAGGRIYSPIMTIYTLCIVILFIHSVQASPMAKPYIAYRTSPFDQPNVLSKDIDSEGRPLDIPPESRRSKIHLAGRGGGGDAQCPLSFSLGIAQRTHSRNKHFTVVAPVLAPIKTGSGKQVIMTTAYEHLDRLVPDKSYTTNTIMGKNSGKDNKASGGTDQGSPSAAVRESLLQPLDYPLLLEGSHFLTQPIVHDVNGDGILDAILSDYHGGIYTIGLGISHRQEKQNQPNKRYWHATQVPRLFVRRSWVADRVAEVTGKSPIEDESSNTTTKNEKDSRHNLDPFHSYFEVLYHQQFTGEDVLQGVSANLLHQDAAQMQELQTRQERRVTYHNGDQIQEENGEKKETATDDAFDMDPTHRRLQEIEADTTATTVGEGVVSNHSPQKDELEITTEEVNIRLQDEAGNEQRQDGVESDITDTTTIDKENAATVDVANADTKTEELREDVPQAEEVEIPRAQPKLIPNEDNRFDTFEHNEEPVHIKSASGLDSNMIKEINQQLNLIDNIELMSEGHNEEVVDHIVQEIEFKHKQDATEGADTANGEQKLIEPNAEERKRRHEELVKEIEEQLKIKLGEGGKIKEDSDAVTNKEVINDKTEGEERFGDTIQAKKDGSDNLITNIDSLSDLERDEADTTDGVADISDANDRNAMDDLMPDVDDPAADAYRYGDDMQAARGDKTANKEDDYGGEGVLDDQYGRHHGDYDDFYGYNEEHEAYYDKSNYIRLAPHILCTPTLIELPKQYTDHNEMENILLVAATYYMDEDEYQGMFSYKRFAETDHGDETEAKRGMYVANAIMAYSYSEFSSRWLGQTHLELSTDYSAPENMTLVGAIPIESDVSKMGAFALGSPTVADIDGDGEPEVLIGTSMGIIYCFHARHLYKRAYFPIQLPHPIESRILVEDVVGDTNLELFVADIGGNVLCLNSKGQIVWNRNLSVSLGSAGEFVGSSPMTLGDVDGDGILDVVIVQKTLERTFVFALNATTGADLRYFPLDVASHEIDYDWDYNSSHEKLIQPLLVNLHGDQDFITDYIRRGGTQWVHPTRKSRFSVENGGNAAGLHIVYPYEDTLYIIEGGSGCMQKLSMGDDVTAMVQVDDIHGTNKLDLLIMTDAGNTITLESQTPYHPLNTWTQGETRSKFNAHAHGYSASQGIYVHEHSRQFVDVFGVYVPVTFEIFDNRPNIANEPSRRKYSVDIRAGPASQRLLFRAIYKQPGIYTERVYIRYGPGYYDIYVTLHTTHGIIYEDSFSIGYNTNFLQGFGMLLWLPLFIMTAVVLLCGHQKKAGWSEEEYGDKDQDRDGSSEGILGRTLPS